MHIQGVSAFRFRTPEQRVKVVDFDVAKMFQNKLVTIATSILWATKKTYVRFVIPIHVTIYAERLTKIGLVVADELTTIVKLKPSCSAISIY